MRDFSNVVDSLEDKVNKILIVQEELLQTKQKLEAEINDLKKIKAKYEKEISDWQEENQSLRLANSILGSDQFKQETKLKINALIREIDLCITQLSV